jgi:hypothetical protein
MEVVIRWVGKEQRKALHLGLGVPGVEQGRKGEKKGRESVGGEGARSVLCYRDSRFSLPLQMV